MRENFGPTKYPREKILSSRNAHEKNYGPTKYLRENILNPRNTHDGTLALALRDPRWHALVLFRMFVLLSF